MHRTIHICPICGGNGIFMGGLGNLNWYRCESCGMEFSKKARRKKQRKLNAAQKLWKEDKKNNARESVS